MSRRFLICGLLLGCGKAPGGTQTKPVASVAAAPAPSASAPAVAAPTPRSSSPPSDWPRTCEGVGPFRWLGGASKASPGAGVATPLAWAGAHVTSAGPACCAPWAARGVTWTALDRFGQVAGTASVAKSEHYDATGCDELRLQTVTGKRGVELWVSAASPYQPAASAEWRPSGSARAGLAALVKTLEAAMVPGPEWAGCDTKVPPLAARTLFFHSTEGDERVRERAVVGGPLLIIAERDPRRGGAWIASFVETSDATTCLPSQYLPKAVIDLNQDGVAEVVVHTDDGPFFGDVVFGFRQLGGWQLVARGVPGSTA